MFTTIIDSHPELTNTEKLQHLRTCLRDTALEISDGNYAIALNLSVCLIFQAHITEILGQGQFRMVPFQCFVNCVINSTLIFAR